MSNVAADFSSQASSASLSKAGRQSLASQKAPSTEFDDLLNSIPDAPAEARDRGVTAAAERTQPAESRTETRSDRTERSNRADQPGRADSKAAAETQTVANEAPPSDQVPPKDAGPAKTDAAVTDAQPTGEDTTAKTEKTEKTETTAKADGTEETDGQTTDTSAVTQTAVDALIAQAVVIDPAIAAVTGEPGADGETVAKTGTGIGTGTGTGTGTGKNETVAAATVATKGGEQQAAALADQTTGLTAEDAEVLSTLAAKAQQGLKDAEGDKTGKRAATDKPVHAAKPTGEAAAAPANDGVQIQAAGGETATAGAKPVQSELAKVAVEHQRGQSEADTKPSADQPSATASANATVKGADALATNSLAATAHTAHAAAGSATTAGSTTSSSDDKPVAIANVAVEITAKISSGKNQFDIRLDPEELGRIHVKVNVDRDGNITTHMVADRPDTLDLLRRDTQGLERALQDAGLKTSDNSLQFSLRDQTQQQQQNQQNGQASRLPVDDEQATKLTTTVIARDYGRYGARSSGVDIRV